MRNLLPLFLLTAFLVPSGGLAQDQKSGSLGEGPRIAPGPTIVKVVSSADGKPVAGVYVRLGGRSAATSVDGTFTLDGIPAGEYAAVIEHPEFDRLEKNVTLAPGKRDPITLTITPETYVPIQGQVVLTETNRPIPCPRISFIPVAVPSAVQGRYDLYGGWDGKFSVLEIPAGKYRAEWSAAGCIPANMEIVIAKGMKDIVLKLAPETETADLAVTVVDGASGKGVANAKIILSEAYPKGFITEGKTDGAGRLTLKKIRVGRLNWLDDKGAVLIARKQVTVRAECDGYESAIVSAVVGGNATVKLNSTAKIAQQEPNDAFTTAQPIRSGAPVEFTIGKVGDIDFFKFHVETASIVKVHLGPNIPIEAVITLFKSDITEFWKVGAGAGAQLVYESGLPAGDYYIRVEEWGNNGMSATPFALKVTCNNVPDPFEPNNAPAVAKLIRHGEEVCGTISPIGDIDFYRFEVKRPSVTRVTMPAHGLEKVVRVANEKGETQREIGYGAGAAVDFNLPLGPGTYTVSVREWGDNGETIEPYALRVEMIEDDGVDDPPIAPKNIRAPRTIPPNGLMASTINPYGDRDLFAIPVPSAGLLKILSISPIEHVLTLYNADGKPIDERGCGARGRGEIHYNATGPAMVYVRVMEWGDNDWSPSPYILRTFWYPADEQELLGRNENAESALPFEPGEPLRGTIMPYGDNDWYRCRIDHPGRIVLDATCPIEYVLRLRDGKKNTLREIGCGANGRTVIDYEVLPGDYYVTIEEWGNNGCSPGAYEIKTAHVRAEAVERVPLANDPVRTLKLNEAQAYAIDAWGDRDRFLFAATAAGKYTIRLRPSVESVVTIFDDITGATLWNVGYGAHADIVIPLEAKGPTRYRIEVVEWGNNGVSARPDYILATAEPREIPAETIAAATDPCDPTKVTFTRAALANHLPARRVRLDADGDGNFDADIPAGGIAHRYRAEGIYNASVLFEGTNGVTSTLRLWVDATGPRERKGIYLFVDFPAEGQRIDKDLPCRARAISYSNARVASVTLAVDGRPVATAYSAPFVIETPWRKLGGGKHTFTFTARDAKGQTVSIERTVELSDYFDLLPEDGAVVTGTNIRVGWTSPGFAPTVVRYRAKGETAWKEVVAESGTTHAALLPAIEAGKPYEFQAVGAGAPSDIRTVTRVKGLAFGRPRYGATIERNYDQRMGISVRNHGEKPMIVRLECGKPSDARLLVGFVGEGSEGAPVPLAPGEERDFMLGISAQDVVTAPHAFMVRITSDSGFTDEAEVDVNVKLPEVKLAWQEIGPAPDGVGKQYRLKNEGDALTDLDVVVDTDNLILSPGVQHGVLPKGATLDVTVTPKLHEGFASAEGVLKASSVGKSVEQKTTCALKEGEKIFGVMMIPGRTLVSVEPTGDELLMTARAMVGMRLNPAAVDWSKRDRPEDADGDGKTDRWKIENKADGILWIGDDTDGDGEIDFVHADVGDDGQFDYSAFKTKDGWEPTNLVEAWLEMGFALPWARTAYEKHDADIVMNGKIVGTLRDAIPEGNYTFRLPPTVINFNEAGSPDNNAVEIHSRHLRGGHYIVSSDFRIKVRLTGTRIWVVSGSQDEAKKAALKTEGLSMDGADYSVSSGEMKIEGPSPLKKGDNAAITVPLRNVGAVRHKELTVALMRGEPGGAPVELERIVVDNPPLVGAKDIQFNWKASAGTHQLRIVVDPGNEVNDARRENNTAMITVTVLGDDAKPTLAILEPKDGVTTAVPVVPIRIEANDDSGISRVEVRIDGGLWRPCAKSEGYATKAFLQPGKHTIAARATDGGGNQVEKTVGVTVEGAAPTGEFVEPAEGTSIDARKVTVRVKTDEKVVKVVFVVNGGAPVGSEVVDGVVTSNVPLEFGPCEIKAVLVDANGARKDLVRRVTCTKQKEAKKKEEGEDPEKKDKPDEKKDEPGKKPDDKSKPPEGKKPEGDKKPDDKKPPAPKPDGKQPEGDGAKQPGGKKPGEPGEETAPGKKDGAKPDKPEDVEGPPEEEMEPGIPTIEIPDYGPVDVIGEPNVVLPPPKQGGDGNVGTGGGTPSPFSPIRQPAGGLVSVEKKKSDRYCTNNPNIKVKFQLPDWLKKKNLPKPGTKEYYEMCGKLLAELKMRGVDVEKFKKFQESLLNRIRGLEGNAELPGWLESWGFGGGKPKNDKELQEWRDRMEEAAEAWWLRLLSSGDPNLIREGLKARGEAIGKFDEASKLAADAVVEEIQAKQKLTEDIMSAVPYVGDAMDIISIVTGETLSGEKMTPLSYILATAGLVGPVALEKLMETKAGREAFEALAEKTANLTGAAKKKLADALGLGSKELDDSVRAIKEASESKARKEANEMAWRAKKAEQDFAASAAGKADKEIMAADRAAALKKIDDLKNAKNADEFDRAVMEIQKDKTAQSLMHGKDVPDALRKDVNGHMKKIYGDVDPKVIKELEQTDHVKALAKKHGIDPKDVKVEVMTITNVRKPKPGGGDEITKIGRDRDVTYVVTTTGPDGKKIVLGDVDHNISKPIYEKEFYKRTKGGELPADPKEISRHADEMDQTVTSKYHPEAYNPGEVKLNDFLDKSKTPTLTRVEDIKDTMTYKSDHWFHKAKEAATPAEAAKHTAEGMRQATKQWDDLVMSRVNQYKGVVDVKIPPRLQEGMDILKRVEKMEITPAQAEKMLEAINPNKAIPFTKERLIQDMGSFVEGLEKGPGNAFRKVKSAEVFDNLAKVPGRGTNEWAEQSLKTVNEALQNGHVTGETFMKMRGDILNGKVSVAKTAKTPAEKAAVREWANNALLNRLIIRSEKEQIEKALGE